MALNHVDNGISIAAACESSAPSVTGLAVRWGFDTRQGEVGTSWSDGAMQMKRDEINLNGGLARGKDNRGGYQPNCG